MGLPWWMFLGLYAGIGTLLLSPHDVRADPSLWFRALSTHKVKTTITSYPTIKQCISSLDDVPVLKNKGVQLEHVENIVVEAAGRTRADVLTHFTTKFAPLGIRTNAVSSAFGCAANVAVTMRGKVPEEPTTLYLDLQALRQDRIRHVSKGQPNSIAVHDSGKLLPMMQLAVANPEDGTMCNDAEVGEIWIASPFNGKGYYGNDEESKALFQCTFPGNKGHFARSGYLGFSQRNDKTGQDEVFIVGALEDSFMANGYRYYPDDVEQAVEKCSRRIYPVR